MIPGITNCKAPEAKCALRKLLRQRAKECENAVEAAFPLQFPHAFWSSAFDDTAFAISNIISVLDISLNSRISLSSEIIARIEFRGHRSFGVGEVERRRALVILDQMHTKREGERGGSRWPKCHVRRGRRQLVELRVVDRVGWLRGWSGCVTKRNGTSQKSGALSLAAVYRRPRRHRLHFC